LGSLLANDTAKGAGWYFMNWYGAMTGNMVAVTVANDATTNMDGACSVDSATRHVTCILGGGNSGTVNVELANLPSFIGSSASVSIEKVDWTSKDTVCNGTTAVSTSTDTVSNGQLTVTMTGCTASSGYRIDLTPGLGPTGSSGDQADSGGSTSFDAASTSGASGKASDSGASGGSGSRRRC
jgi:hypothetical protein